MVKYIGLLRFTEEGARAIKDSTRRAQAFNDALSGTEVRIVGQYWTIGHYDGVIILEADSGKKVLHCLSKLVASGAVRSETMQAFEAEEFDKIVGG